MHSAQHLFPRCAPGLANAAGFPAKSGSRLSGQRQGRLQAGESTTERHAGKRLDELLITSRVIMSDCDQVCVRCRYGLLVLWTNI